MEGSEVKESLKPEHVKKRLLGHWGSSPGLAFMYVHLNRLINEYDRNAIFLAGPGHGAPAVLAPVWLEGMRNFFHQFSFPGGIGSHCTPESPGSIHEGGELGYSPIVCDKQNQLQLPQLRVAGAPVKEKLRDIQIECRNYAYENGVDMPEIDNWQWPY